MRRAVAILVWIGVSTVGWAQAPDRLITLQEALNLMRARNPALRSARSHLEAVKDNEITAGLRPNPILNSANEDFNIFKPSRFDIRNSQEFTQNVSQLVERGHKRFYRGESARWATTVAKDSYRDQERLQEFALKSSFATMLLAKSNVQLAQDNWRDYRETVRLNEIRLKAGDISLTEFNRIALEQARFENDLQAARLSLAQARVQVQNLMGLQDYSDHFDIDGKLGAPLLLFSLKDLQMMALNNRPDYLAARDGIKLADANVKLADANGTTDLAVGGEYKRNGPDNTVGVTLNFPLRIFDRNQGEKARTRHELESSQANEMAVRHQVLADVKQAYDAYQTVFARVQLYSQDYLDRARDVRDRTEFSYRHGGASLLDFLDAVRNYRDVELAWRSSNAQLLIALHQLSFVTGTELMP